jgi:hypothetical protein
MAAIAEVGLLLTVMLEITTLGIQLSTRDGLHGWFGAVLALVPLAHHASSDTAAVCTAHGVHTSSWGRVCTGVSRQAACFPATVLNTAAFHNG